MSGTRDEEDGNFRWHELDSSQKNRSKRDSKNDQRFDSASFPALSGQFLRTPELGSEGPNDSLANMSSKKRLGAGAPLQASNPFGSSRANSVFRGASRNTNGFSTIFSQTGAAVDSEAPTSNVGTSRNFERRRKTVDALAGGKSDQKVMNKIPPASEVSFSSHHRQRSSR